MKIINILLLLCFSAVIQASPIDGLLERIDKGASRKFVIEQIKSPTDFFELDQKGDKVVIRGNNYVSIATGINWYLKYYAGIHLSWNGMQATLPEVLPAVTKKERHETGLKLRYDLNYCTFSYTMAFWDWDRWEKEIDWMALHGINLPLAMTGVESVWYNVLKKLGYNKEEINEFISGPGFMAWWLMNNLEGWGGPNPDSWYQQQTVLQKKILKRMREYGIEPVLPGYSGMVPHNAKEKLGLNVSDPGLWCGYRRPAFLQPTDPRFQEIASLYYKEMEKLFGKANYYSMDPFHEGGNVAGVDLDAAGKAIMSAMKKVNPKAVWVAQAWQANPRSKMIENLKAGDMIVLDLFAESRPQWGDTESTWYRKSGFGQHDWIYCMLLNYGGNVGLHGKMAHVIDEFYKAKESPFGKTLCGVGMTMEGSENNPVMFELLTELPWREQRFDKEEWLTNYVHARYGSENKTVEEAWTLLSKSIYNCPPQSVQQGTHESIFCARPSENVYQASSWSEMSDYYNPQDVIRAARLMVSVADQYKGNNNFEYDLVDIVRQAITERGRLLYKAVMAAYTSGDKTLFEMASRHFLQLILLQDELLGTRREFMVGNWIDQARNLGKTPEEKALYEWNARVQITTWGNRQAADEGGLRDYAHKEWNGILKDFYYMRWKAYFDNLTLKMNGKNPEEIDFYALEEPWTKETDPYPFEPKSDCISTVKRIFADIFN
ncbi:alpha-N-acetylglucosaminidase [Parabacteroides sp. GYB001]|uniref:alpha-N-acetylglucosaminidase n=1 Tax=Parabacteroides leei TaxID=2939491 RepID=UPI00201825FD|nr:alpha-N-acetylglucosaminidase [Parabacteroides leei]MCL3851684.1 alpha-N-acetylglucosaminidase [Parabacteroides leei]